MNKNKILQYVTELQELRDRFDSELFPATLPGPGCRGRDGRLRQYRPGGNSEPPFKITPFLSVAPLRGCN